MLAQHTHHSKQSTMRGGGRARHEKKHTTHHMVMEKGKGARQSTGRKTGRQGMAQHVPEERKHMTWNLRSNVLRGMCAG